jgi:hypothetical protein
LVIRLAALCAALLILACAAPIRVEPGRPPPSAPVRRVELRELGSDPASGTFLPYETQKLVTAQLRAALAASTGFQIVEPGAGADAVLSGNVRRFTERDGSASGVQHPASVAIDLVLHDKAGVRIWAGSYDETQRALSEDVGSLPRVWQRGFRWVTAEELAQYGVRTLVEELAREARAWS